MYYRVIEKGVVEEYDVQVPEVSTDSEPLTLDELAKNMYDFLCLPGTERFVHNPLNAPIMNAYGQVVSRIPRKIGFLKQRTLAPVNWLREQSGAFSSALGSRRVLLTRQQFAKLEQAQLITSYNCKVQNPIRGDKTGITLFAGEPDNVLTALLKIGVNEEFIEKVFREVMEHEKVHLHWAKRFAELFGFKVVGGMFLEMLRHPYVHQGEAGKIETPTGIVSLNAHISVTSLQTLDFETLFRHRYAIANATVEYTNGNGTFTDAQQAERYLRLLSEGIHGEYIDADAFHQFVIPT